MRYHERPATVELIGRVRDSNGVLRVSYFTYAGMNLSKPSKKGIENAASELSKHVASAATRYGSGPERSHPLYGGKR